VIKTASKINHFFLELTLMLLILALSMAVCLQIFLYAHTTADYSRDLSNATIKAQSVAACYKSFAGDLGRTAEYLAGSGYVTDKMTLYYDKEWRPAAVDEGSYHLNINEDGQVASINVVRVEDQLELFSIKVRAADYE
jgi:hypothetical protein